MLPLIPFGPPPCHVPPLPSRLSPCATNPHAARAAKKVYGAALANVDWLHGSAEFLLTLTNLFIVLGMRGEGAGHVG